MKAWYAKKTGGHQGLVIEEQTGRNIAVTYEANDAAIIANAVNCHSALMDTLHEALPYVEMAEHDPAYKKGAVAKMVRQIKNALAKSEVS